MKYTNKNKKKKKNYIFFVKQLEFELIKTFVFFIILNLYKFKLTIHVDQLNIYVSYYPMFSNIVYL